MGKKPTNEPEEKALKKLIEMLGAAGCKLQWKGITPFYERGPNNRIGQFWEVWGGALAPNARSKWLNFHPDRDQYTEGIRDTERTMLAVLEGKANASSFKYPTAPIVIIPGENLLPDDAGPLIYQHWCDHHPELLQDTREELRRVHEKRKRLIPSASSARPAWLGLLAESLLTSATLLERDDLQARITDPKARQNLFLRPVQWNSVCRGGYAERPILRERLVQEFDRFLDTCESAIGNMQLPIFWIGGRSGDGKSVLLLQLCHLLKQTDPTRPIALFKDPEALLTWIEDVALSGSLPDGMPFLLTVVDDLHKVEWVSAKRVLENCATQGPRLAIVTCGPNPERTLFIEEVMGTSNLALTKADTTRFADADFEVLAQHLDIRLDTGGENTATLVERIFLALYGGGASIGNFAHSLKNRIDTRLGRNNLLAQLAGMAWLDLPLPRDLVRDTEAEWLTELAGETQLHISVVEGGFRFGHPAIARPVFDAITRSGAQTPPLKARITETLSQILNEVKSTQTVGRILSQVLGRLGADPEIDVVATLEAIAEKANNVRLKSIAVSSLISRVKADKGRTRVDWRSLGRTYRRNASLEPQIRAKLATNLALNDAAERSDFEFALDLVKDPVVAPFMAQFLADLCVKRIRNKGWTYLAIQPAADWAAKHDSLASAQHVLVAFLSQYPTDTRLHHALNAVMKNARQVEHLAPGFMAQVAKCLEEEMEEAIKRWLTAHRMTPAFYHVLEPLLKKPGTKWDDFASDLLDKVARGGVDWLAGLTAIAPHLQSRDLIDRLPALATEYVTSPPGDAKVGGFFVRLAEHAGALGVEQIVIDRLDALWTPEILAEPEGERQAALLLGKSWPALADRQESFPERARYVFDKLLEPETLSIRGELPNSRVRLRKALRGSVHHILRSGRHLKSCWRSVLTYYDACPDDELSGLAAAQLAALDGAHEGDNDGWLDEWRRREHELIRSCWAWAAKTDLQDKAIGHLCTAALLKCRWNDETDAVRELVISYWYPSPRYGDSQVLQALLRHPHGSAEAWNYILDRRYDIDRHHKLRAEVLARNLDYAFERINEGSLSSAQQSLLLHYLEVGVGDFEVNEQAAWAALQRLETWPKVAEKFLWRGVLRSARVGFTLRRESYEQQFNAWQAVHQDPYCESYLTARNTVSVRS